MRKSFSVWSAFDAELSPEDAVLALEERGMTECELSDEHGAMLMSRGNPEKTGREFREFASAHGVAFPQGHLWLRARLCDPVNDSVPILCDWIRLYGAVGVRNAVLHCDAKSFPKETPTDGIFAANIAVLKCLAPVAEASGVRICLENLRAVFSSAEDLLRVVRGVGGDSVGICLDTGHLNISKAETQEHFIRTAGKKLWALHIADNEGETDQHMMPMGRGNVDFPSVMRALDEIGYRGLFNYEIPGERLPMPLRRAKVDYLRTVNDYLFSLIGQ